MVENPQSAAVDASGDEALAPLDEPVTFETNKYVDLAVTVAVFAIGAFIVWTATGFRAGSFPDPVTARGLPYFTGSFMMFGAVVTAARQLAAWNRFPGAYTLTAGAPDEPGQEASALRAFAVVGLSLLLVVLLRPLGFLIIAPVVLFAMLLVMNVRSPAKLIGFPLGFTATIWLLFSQILGVVLPLGPLTVVARSWGLTP